MAYSLRAEAIVFSGARKSREFRITPKFKTDATIKDLQKALRNLDNTVIQIMTKYAKETIKTIKQQFNKTAVYSRPSRKTGNLLRALDQYSVSRYGQYVIAKIGNKAQLPFYWRIQESGRGAYTFQEKFVKVWRDGKPKLYTVRPAAPGTRNTIQANPGSVGTTNQYFKLHRKNITPVVLTIRHPGVRARGFIEAGRAFMFSSLTKMQREILEKAKPKGKRGVSYSEYFKGL